MTDRPIIFSAPMVRALLEGRKTQTRRVLRPQPFSNVHPSDINTIGDADEWERVRIPYAPGDRLWVREAFSYEARDVDRCGFMPPWYWSDGNPEYGDFTRPKPSIHMPRWASRLTLIVTDVRVQRVQEISAEDAKSEGAPAIGAELCPPDLEDTRSYIWVFHNLWNSIHGPGAWAANPWVAAITFDVKRGNIDTPSNPDEVA